MTVRWEHAVRGNTVRDPACDLDPAGNPPDRIVDTDVPPTLANLHALPIGVYGVFWDGSAGFVWANVDHATDFAPASSSVCFENTDCDDGDDCTLDTCDPGDIGADAFGCVHEDILVPFGDIFPLGAPNGIVDFDDILCVLNGFANIEDCPDGDIVGLGNTCPPFTPNGIDFDDVLADLDAFAGNPLCPDACPADP